MWVEGRRILGPVSLSVAPGRSLAITGPSGSGKSTLLGCLAGLRRPTTGAIRFGETEISRLTPSEAASFRRAMVGQVFQDSDLLEELSVVENVMLPALFRGAPRDEARGAATRSLAAVGLDDRADDATTKLSGGEAQRVALARALVTPVSVLLADEPTASLDNANVQSVVASLLGACARAETCLVVATHDDLVAASCDSQLSLGRRSEAL